MALNYSQRPIFSAHTSEDNLGIEEMRDCFGYGRERVDNGGSPEPDSVDIIDLLPADPFVMDIDINTTFTAISGWFEDLEVDYGAFVGNNNENVDEDFDLITGVNWIFNSAMKFQSYPSNESPDIKGGAGCLVDSFMRGCQFKGVEGDDIMGYNYNYGSTSGFVTESENHADGFGHSSNVVGEDPHEAFVLALGYLGTKDLFSVERVCRSLCYTVHNDPLLWMTIHIDQPLNERITDDILLQLVSRAEGNLQCLALINCPRITDDGLKRVIETNPKMTKLSIPGCTRLSIEGILKILKTFKSSKGTSGIKQIRTGGFYGMTHEHFKDLKFLLGTDDNMQKNNHISHYYQRGNLYRPSDDDRDTDVELCPRCQNVRLVYDCPLESCQVKDQRVDVCRACIICIPRCARCGRCVHNSEYEETFSLEYLCSGCLKELPSYQKVQEMDVDVSDGSSETVCLHG
ncbi:F-box protein SKIP14-like [Rutidosis leptorrhynchoides]|uniref:F-box protein SKIP14-like n=1 Tax=Rutidosis leptorrhynchoides TaxID=125765 RepID=UPI003A9A1978